MLRIVLSTALLLLLSIPEDGSAMRVKLLTLGQMVEQAEIVFVGRCLTSTAQDDPQFGQTVTVIEFEVVEALKGQLSETHTLKQYGGTGESTSHRIAGMPTYTPGEDVILFLYGESQYGLASPVGISQGKFTFVGDDDSSSPSMIVNSINNNGLLEGLGRHALMNANRLDEPKRKAIQRLVRGNRGPIPYEDFLLITKTLIGRDENQEE
ncbi:MAG TPA: hypothetical protein EYN18_00625 [Nitrospirales bacterium]|nr:hypothetical protein [Nitrospirales bacterium]HIO20891.1 hypothetical protein [Nitrospirales bacterium]